VTRREFITLLDGAAAWTLARSKARSCRPSGSWKANRQGAYVEQGYPNPTPSITVMPRNTPKANIVCWTPCGQPGAIVLGADPDPNVRAYLLKDASGYFGGGTR
jgi:hypothetical protein